MEIEKILTKLCSCHSVSGDESEAGKTACKLTGLKPETDNLGNYYVFLGKKDCSEQYLLDAHADQVGMIVTRIDDKGFLHFDSCGGIDRRVLLGCPVTVFAKEKIKGVIGSIPPHLQNGENDKIPDIDQMSVDIGMSKKDAEKLVLPGDRILPNYTPKKLLGTRFTSAALDNRAGCAVLIRCAKLLKECNLNCGITFMFSTREEIGGQGSITGTYKCNPTKAICVDVSFGDQPGVKADVSWPLGKGAMIGRAPILDRNMGNKLMQIADKNNIPWKWDVMGGKTGTNADHIAVSRGGVKTALLSIPLRNMHTTAEIIDIDDIENIALLLAEYLREENDG